MKYKINQDKYLSKYELDELISRISNNDSKYSLLIRLGLATGARAQELLNLTHKDLSLQNQSVYIRGLKGSLDRELPLEKNLFDALKGLPLNETLFNISYSYLVKVWAMWTQGITTKSFKSLRHTYAMELYEKSNDLLLVQAALGHAVITSTLVYSEHFYKTRLLQKLRA